jgi:septal ring factor EnvC (AmiA/AmiB activator)
MQNAISQQQTMLQQEYTQLEQSVETSNTQQSSLQSEISQLEAGWATGG